jgi:hypothetical protein
MKNSKLKTLFSLHFLAVMFWCSNPPAFAQTKPEEGWRPGERKFAELADLTLLVKQLDEGTFRTNRPARETGITLPMTGKRALLTVADIEKECGRPYLCYPPKPTPSGARMCYYGRLRYITEDGKTIKGFAVFYDASKLEADRKKRDQETDKPK